MAPLIALNFGAIKWDQKIKSFLSFIKRGFNMNNYTVVKLPKDIFTKDDIVILKKKIIPIAGSLNLEITIEDRILPYVEADLNSVEYLVDKLINQYTAATKGVYTKGVFNAIH